ncbi:alpha/beta hydrolase [Inconstantimicrobium mannanitabidum]|uniref:Alpha/beta hydrolase n=1 Tax=Inconstantimicrobium mannanitabidum TaxID=1604901 RepID=A0ACB5RC73_9CLOT|nr:alpha/beta hydrolase [Clostridium sp. TW13]GKX66833.1 alpha/beta hydrolase [Clostridium sp. TW13]
MKKIVKYLCLFAFIICFILIIVFRNRILLSINMIRDVGELNTSNNVATSSVNKNIVLNTNYKDIVYKNGPNSPQTLDIYSAKKANTNGSPVIIYVHGGSWAYGDKNIPQNISPLLDMLRDQGYTVISTSYHLMKDKVIFNEQIEDVKDTVRWIRKNKDKYNLNPDAIGVIGTSAGAHLALMASYTSDSEYIGDVSLKNYSSKVKYVIDFSGPTDLTTLDLSQASPDITKLIKSSSNTEKTLSEYSPINHINKDLPNTLIIHSKKDNMVPYRNSTLLYNKIKAAGSDAKLITLSNSNHDFSNITNDDITTLSMEILKFIISNSPL